MNNDCWHNIKIQRKSEPDKAIALSDPPFSINNYLIEFNTSTILSPYAIEDSTEVPVMNG